MRRSMRLLTRIVYLLTFLLWSDGSRTKGKTDSAVLSDIAPVNTGKIKPRTAETRILSEKLVEAVESTQTQLELIRKIPEISTPIIMEEITENPRGPAMVQVRNPKLFYSIQGNLEHSGNETAQNSEPDPSLTTSSIQSENVIYMEAMDQISEDSTSTISTSFENEEVQKNLTRSSKQGESEHMVKGKLDSGSSEKVKINESGSTTKPKSNIENKPKKKLVSERYTNEERAALDKFRPLIEGILTKEYQHADSYLIRWLRAKTLNIRDATNMLQKAQKWRRENQIDGILKERNSLLEARFFELLNTFDKDGAPILQYTMARLDLRRLLLEGKKNQLLREYTHMFEKMSQISWETSKQAGRDSSHFIVLGDMQGFNPRQHLCLQCMVFNMEWIQILENYYPGAVKLGVILNAPRSYNVLFERIFPLMSEHTRKTSKTFGVNKNEWSSFLLQKISADQRTFQFGGTKRVMTS